LLILYSFKFDDNIAIDFNFGSFLFQKELQMHYRWWILFSCFLLELLAGGIVTLGFTAFFDPIANEFNWSYAQIALAASLRGAEVGVIAPMMGFIVDRYGPKRVVISGVIILGCGLIFLSRINSLIAYYLAFGIIAIGMSALSPTVFTTTLSNWFTKKLGMATGILSSGFAFGGLLVPIIITLINIYDWRTTIVILSIGIFVIGLPLSLIIKNRPDNNSELQDKNDENNAKSLNNIKNYSSNANFTVKQALKNRAFWGIGLSSTLIMLTISAMTVHVMPSFSTVDINRTTAGIVATSLPLMSIIGRFVSGWLIDKVNKNHYIAAAFFLMVGLGSLVFSFISIDKTWLIFPFIFLYSTGWGGNLSSRAGLTRQYFGRLHFGAIFGLIAGMAAIGSILGPFIAGLIFDTNGSYTVVWFVFAAFGVLAAAILATLPNKI
jgi:sugar phosphate permease